MTNPQPLDVLEQRAAEQRRQMHQSVEDLRGAVKHRLDVNVNARQFLAPASGILALAGLALGYGVAGLFSRKR
ncbi:MAG TPA: hypothetical protein VM056_05750 [Terriglobales bacterium]|nr:hypothetical protein [Terriglobales bacterium]